MDDKSPAPTDGPGASKQHTADDMPDAKAGTKAGAQTDLKPDPSPDTQTMTSQTEPKIDTHAKKASADAQTDSRTHSQSFTSQSDSQLHSKANSQPDSRPETQITPQLSPQSIPQLGPRKHHTSSAPTSNNHTPKQSSSAATSRNHSPVPSREVSPSRKHRRVALAHPSISANPSRRNSPSDLSPVRPAKSASDSAPRTPLSATIPTLRPLPRESPILSPTPHRPDSAVQACKDSRRWPLSPDLPSPPPHLRKPSAAAAARNEAVEAPSVNVQRPSPKPPDSQQSSTETDSDDAHMRPGVRTPVRAALETVQEVSQNSSPAHTLDAPFPDQHGPGALPLEDIKEKLPISDDQSSAPLWDAGTTPKAKANNIPGPLCRGGDAMRSRSESRRPSSVPPPPTPTLVSRQSSALSTKQLKSKPEGSTQNMTVETETVPSVPQVVLAASAKAEAANGTLKTKPSAETIKPKKDKKKAARKQPAVNSGAASSKADIFEAKIANAVDEANTSDSEETFVYDSNPPDNAERSTRRFHSRTPSATSMASQADRPNLRSIYGVMEGGSQGHSHSHGPVPKKSMKFVNSFGGNTSEGPAQGEDDGKGTGRSAGGSARGTMRHHHIGRWGRQPGNGHASLFDNESPFPNAAKSKLGGNSSRNSSGPTSPRNHLSGRGQQLGAKRPSMQMTAAYDVDDTTGPDDEHTPLMEATRSARGIRSRRGPHNLRQAESQTYTRRSSYLNRFAACLVLTMMILLVITGAIGFMFATSQPMTGIEIVSISNVVTSEQVLMYDLTVKAHNPNIVVLTIDRANLELFAKSNYAGNDPDQKRQRHGGADVEDDDDDDEDRGRLHARDDPLNDPPLAPGEGVIDRRPNILLGRITSFDSSLTFEGSLFNQGTSSSTAQMQLKHPGDNTTDGSDQWNHIYQHEFDLIVKGVVQYSLPLSANVRSATVSGRATVKPNSANNPSPKPNATILG